MRLSIIAHDLKSKSNPFSFYSFLSSVLQNHVHVTVAGTVGTWWFSPEEASSCCSSAVRDSFYRASTYSFGSICMGSLLVAIIQAAKQMLHALRENGDGVCSCIAECCLGCIESIAEYFNQWAFVFVGLYGYSFMEAGRTVMHLFYSRGWTVIITDYLVDRVLLMISFLIGLILGLLAIVVSTSMGLVFPEEYGGSGVPFV